MTAKRALQLQVEGRAIAISNLEKVLYPTTGFTKGRVVDLPLYSSSPEGPPGKAIPGRRQQKILRRRKILLRKETPKFTPK
jgi:hypothetical protein